MKILRKPTYCVYYRLAKRPKWDLTYKSFSLWDAQNFAIRIGRIPGVRTQVRIAR